MPKDLRTYLAQLSETYPNQLKVVDQEVDRKWEITAFVEKLRRDKKEIDLAFNLCDDGFFSDPELEPHLPAILDVLEIPYTGGNYLTLALTLKKEI